MKNSRKILALHSTGIFSGALGTQTFQSLFIDSGSLDTGSPQNGFCQQIAVARIHLPSRHHAQAAASRQRSRPRPRKARAGSVRGRAAALREPWVRGKAELPSTNAFLLHHEGARVRSSARPPSWPAAAPQHLHAHSSRQCVSLNHF